MALVTGCAGHAAVVDETTEQSEVGQDALEGQPGLPSAKPELGVAGYTISGPLPDLSEFVATNPPPSRDQAAFSRTTWSGQLSMVFAGALNPSPSAPIPAGATVDLQITAKRYGYRCAQHACSRSEVFDDALSRTSTEVDVLSDRAATVRGTFGAFTVTTAAGATLKVTTLDGGKVASIVSGGVLPDVPAARFSVGLSNGMRGQTVSWAQGATYFVNSELNFQNFAVPEVTRGSSRRTSRVREAGGLRCVHSYLMAYDPSEPEVCQFDAGDRVVAIGANGLTFQRVTEGDSALSLYNALPATTPGGQRVFRAHAVVNPYVTPVVAAPAVNATVICGIAGASARCVSTLQR